MEKPKVSVIVPVYNTAPYVEEAVRSVMKQTLRDIEIWIIDDGSTDESPSIVSRLACEEA
ncbi:MAG: glycosyltransferase, partial [Alistipes sp.]